MQSLTEDVISSMLQVIEEEQKRMGETPCSEPLAIQMAACIVSLCGWAARWDVTRNSFHRNQCCHMLTLKVAWKFRNMGQKSVFLHLSPALHAMSLPILTCSYCMRKVGLWNFHQMEGMGGEADNSTNTLGTPVQATSPASATPNDGQGEHSTSTSPSPATTPCRMKLRSQDSTRSDQVRRRTRHISRAVPLAGKTLNHAVHKLWCTLINPFN